MKKVFFILFLLVFISSAYAATIYKWVDKDGVVNFTDDLEKVPSSYQDRVEVETRKDVKEEVTPPAPQAVTGGNEQEEIKKDIVGRDEAWWREKLRPWKEKLKEATEKYEEAQKTFTKKSEELSQTKFYFRSRSQTPWEVMELNRLNEEKKKYEAQMAEANEMLEKLKKEAEETKADPAWLE
jgi:hypothetical protein